MDIDSMVQNSALVRAREGKSGLHVIPELWENNMWLDVKEAK